MKKIQILKNTIKFHNENHENEKLVVLETTVNLKITMLVIIINIVEVLVTKRMVIAIGKKQ